MRCLIFLFYLTSGFIAFSQHPPSLSLKEVHELAKENYPAWQQREFLSKSTALKLERLKRTNRPDILWEARGTAQSHALKVPFSIPGQEPIELPLVNAQTYAEARYLIYDGGMRSAQKDILVAEQAAEEQALEVDWQHMKGQLNQAFFAILLLRKQKGIVELTRDNLDKQRQLLDVGFKNGVVLESDVLKLEVRSVELQSRINEIDADLRTAVQTLSYLTGKALPEDIALSPTNLSLSASTPVLSRPELKLFDLRKEQLLSREKMTRIQNKPRLSAFGRFGGGYPDPLNLFNETFKPFGLAGIQMSWSLFDWGRGDLDRQVLSVQGQILENKKETFAFQIDMLDSRFKERVTKVQTQIKDDRKVADLQQTISIQLEAQLKNGVITTTEYLQQVNATLQAGLQLEAHQMELQQLIADYELQRGKW